MDQKIDQKNNPNGENNNVVRLDVFEPGEIRILRQFIPGTKPVEVRRMKFENGQNRLSIEKEFRGVIAGRPKDLTKKWELQYVGFSDEEIKQLQEKEKLVNRK